MQVAGRLAILALVFVAVVVSGAAARQPGVPAPVAAPMKTKVNPKDGLTYVWISPGSFQMGCSHDDSQCEKDEKPVHTVKLTEGFWIGQTLVTQAAYQKVVGTNPSMFKGDALPVDYVSWDDATGYCKKVDMRLLTEAEYEYAARGASAAARYAPLEEIAWYSADSMGTTHAVQGKRANGYGLYDMLGNLWVWVSDWYGRYGAPDAADPRGPATGPAGVLRGGSWRNDGSRIRASARLTDGRANQFYEYGIRCAGD